MALRLSQPATAGSTSTVPAFQALPTRARPLLATGDLAGYRALFAEAAAEPDLHQRYGARRDLLQAGLTVSRGSARVLAHTFLIGMQTMEEGYAPLVGTTAAISAFVWLLGLAYLYVELTTDERAMGAFVTVLLASIVATLAAANAC